MALCSVFSFSSLPATPVTVALYLVSIIQRKDSRCCKSKLNQIFYSITWAHELNALNSPCTDVWLKLCLQGCIRKVALPVIKKEPFTISILTAMVSRFATTENCYLGDLRIVTLFVVAFACFFVLVRFYRLSVQTLNSIVLIARFMLRKAKQML